ncbi:MAG: ComEC/Rec2 family competence protein, partial [Lachnospiraceae bacterium]|nr:ComEC/Rec2 family competence protein [Lachnospiraceae bacterium]
CLTFILLFSMLIGGGISPTRAIFMFALKILGDVLGRTYDMLTAVTLALFLMLLEQPYYVGHAGFLLSFGAVLGISVLVPVLEDAFGKHRMLPSVAIFLATFPVLLRFYFTFSPYATLLNLLIIPLMNVVLIDGILVLAVGLITLSGGMAFMALPDRLILGIYEKACLIFQALPGSLQICGQPPLWKVILYYPGLLVLFLLFRKGKMPRMVLVQGILVLLMVFAVPISGPGVKVTGIDVGQGLSVLVQNDNGEAFLFDAGSTTKKDTGKYQIAPCLKALGVGKLKAVFLSHPDEDHINGMMQLLKEAENGGLRIGQIILPQADPQLLTGYEAIADAAKGLKIPVRVADKETTFSSGNLVFFCLNPVKDLYAADINEISQTWLLYKPAGRMERLRRKKKGTSILLTGDITGSAEEAMTRQLEVTMENLGITSINLLQVAHHGSAYSTTDAFLQVAEPKEALISCGIDNSYGHPHQELLERLQQRHIRILRTDRLGAVSWTP